MNSSKNYPKMPKPANKKTIAVDIDDVIAAHAAAFVGYSNKKWGTSLSVNDYTDHWSQLWSVDEKEMKNRIHDYHQHGAFSRYGTIHGSEEVLRKLKSNYKLAVLTARQRSLQEDTIDWITKNFSNIFDEIHFADIWNKPLEQAEKLNKTELAQQIDAEYLIEDQLKYALPAAEAGIKVLLFGDYPWNQVEELPERMIRVKNWQEVLQYFNEQG